MTFDKTMTVEEAQADFDSVMDEVEEGTHVGITKDGRVVGVFISAQDYDAMTNYVDYLGRRFRRAHPEMAGPA